MTKDLFSAKTTLAPRGGAGDISAGVHASYGRMTFALLDIDPLAAH
jgi:hypothetical protein